jgi:hypothetical protein
MTNLPRGFNERYMFLLISTEERRVGLVRTVEEAENIVLHASGCRDNCESFDYFGEELLRYAQKVEIAALAKLDKLRKLHEKR